MKLERWSVDLEKQVAKELADAPIPFAGDGKRPVWTIDTPPPYPSGRWHIGAVAGYSLIDMIARSKRMAGHDVLFPWGVDRNGINIEFTVEKKTGKRMKDWDRAEFIDACAQEITQYSDDMVRIGQRIGLSCDFDNGYATDSPEYRGFSQAQFLKLFEEGQVVEDLRPNTYDPKLGTTIADAEVFYEERKTRLNHVKWTVKETGETIVISTTRPELICACRVVLVHPDNEATKHLIGKTAVLPIDREVDADGEPTGLPNEVPIQADGHVKTDYGSGIMMVCSFGDQADVQLFRELELEPIAAIGMDGRMTAAAGKYTGFTVQEAKQAILDDLQEAGRLDGFEGVDQKFPISERSKAPVEIILLKEWYVRQTHVLDELRDVAKGMTFVPPKHRQLLLDWIDGISIDWPISRRRYYHTEIPLWYLRQNVPKESTSGELQLPFLKHGPEDVELPPCRATTREDGAHEDVVVVPPASDGANPPYYRPWAEEPPAGSSLVCRACREHLGSLDGLLEDAGDKAGKSGRSWAVVGETKVFDTWMDSSVSNLFILKDHQGKEWAADHVCSIRPQGRDIVRTWLYYTVLKSYLLREEPAFENAWIHGMGMDKHGRKMSKSTGNVIDPDEVLEKHGSDAFRLWIAGECTIGDDFRIDQQKIQGTGKFLQKLGNVVNFVSRFPRPDAPEQDGGRPAGLHPVDEWILGELDAVTRDAVQGYGDIDFFSPANRIRSFVWNLFAPHYVEMVKGRAYGDEENGIEPDPAACWTLHEVVRRVLLLLAPIAPFVTHYLGDRVYGLDVHRATFPEPLGLDADPARTEAITQFNSHVWKEKKDQGISLAKPIEGIEVPEELADMADVLVSMHNLDATSHSEVAS